MKLLNPNEQMKYSMNNKIFERADALLSQALDKHSQLTITRFEVHPVKEDINIMRFNQRLVEMEKRKGNDPLYMTVPEIGESGNIHFHELFILNGNKTRHGWSLLQDAKRVLKNMLGDDSDQKCGKIHLSKYDSQYEFILRRNAIDKETISELSKKINYIAKLEQKDKIKGKSFYSSQIKK